MGKLTADKGGRQRVIQQEPPAALDLSAFPSDPLPSSTPLYRAHSVGNGPWYFGNSLKGRFDLVAPRGTCYAAESIGAAMRERLGEKFTGGGQISAELADSAVITTIMPPPGCGANVEAGTENYPLTSELTSMPDYSIPQAWAAAFDQAGFDAIHYRGRLSSSSLASWALFDDEGEHPDYITGATVSGRQACQNAGIRVLPPPPSAASLLRVVPPPT